MNNHIKAATALFHCETIHQFCIGTWLIENGITQEDICRVELLTPDSMKVTNPAGQYMILRYQDKTVIIDPT